uniref:Uncharacterized protein n=1 Tax=Panagrolaimus sp. JU765 TaxID=591449 RepID=A0AC34R3Q6_9BILA
MDPNQEKVDSGLYIVINTGRKRRTNNNPVGTTFTKQPARMSDRSQDNPVPRSCVISPSTLRTRMPYAPQQVVVTRPMAKTHVPGVASALQMYEQNQYNTTDDFQDGNYGAMVDYNVMSTSRYEEPSMCIAPDGTYRPMIVDPESITDLVQLREALNSANILIQDLLEREKKLKREKVYIKTCMNNERQRCEELERILCEELERILFEQNMRIKQVLAENVKWSTRYNRLKLFFGEDDMKNALGDLAPNGR